MFDGSWRHSALPIGRHNMPMAPEQGTWRPPWFVPVDAWLKQALGGDRDEAVIRQELYLLDLEEVRLRLKG